MKKTIEETTRLLLQGNLTKEEADKILLDLYGVSQQRELLLFFLSKINKDAIDLFNEGKGQIVIDHFLKNKGIKKPTYEGVRLVDSEIGTYRIVELLDEYAESKVKNLHRPLVSGSLPSEDELQKVVERIAYEQHSEDQAEDCYTKMGVLHEFVKTYVKGGNDR